MCQESELKYMYMKVCVQLYTFESCNIQQNAQDCLYLINEDELYS